MNINPFNITKAVDYSDEQINSFWVDFPGSSFTDILKPTSPMPMIILGGKGSGKTHIMRYFSYSLQRLRFININELDGIKRDGYLGIYMRCSGLNSDRFFNKGQELFAWKTVFSFYMELWLAQLTLNSIIQTKLFNDLNNNELELQITNQIIDQFDKILNRNSFTSLRDILSYIRDLQKNVDYEINNCALTGKKILDVDITITPGKLLFGIPQIFSNYIPELKGIKFLYLIDEFENLLEYQQQYINTLIREKEDPVTFKIGSRLYGIKTSKTFSADEELKEGSEYEIFNLDRVFRENENDYKKFVIDICIKRLRNSGFYNISESEFENSFEESNIKNDIEINISKDKSYFIKIDKRLSRIINKKEDRLKIISNLKFPDDLILEKTNVFLFYRKWKTKGMNFLETSIEIKKNCEDFYKTKNEKSEHHVILDKFKNDITDQLYRELTSKVPYLGINNYIKISAGIPRHLLIILKHIYRWSSFNGEQPFHENSKISKYSQMSGLKEASDWFISDARIPSKEGTKVDKCLERLGGFLQEIRFSDLPPECSISSFSFMSSNVSSEIQPILNYLEQYSYLILVNNRRDKNSNRKDIVYQINGIIAPTWELSIHRRGILQLTERELKAIFIPDDDSEYKKALNARLHKYNAPFDHIHSLELF